MKPTVFFLERLIANGVRYLVKKHRAGLADGIKDNRKTFRRIRRIETKRFREHAKMDFLELVAIMLATYGTRHGKIDIRVGP